MLKETILLVFCPSRFVQFATEQTIKTEFKCNEQLRKSFPDEKLPYEKYREFEEGTRKSTNTIRHSFAVGFGWVLVAVVGGLCIGQLLSCIIGLAPKLLIAGLQLLAAGIILGATLSFVGQEIETYGGQTLPEKVNRSLYRSLYIIGTAILVISLTWPQ